MNRFLGLSGVIHLTIFAGIIYFCATYDYSSPFKIDRAELDLKAAQAQAPIAKTEEAPAVKEIQVAQPEKIETLPTTKLDKAARAQQKAIEKFEKKMAETPKVLPKAKFEARKEKTEGSQVAAQQEDVNIPVVAPTEEKKDDDQAVRDQFEKDRAEFAQKSQEEKQALLAKLKSMNQAAEEKVQTEKQAATQATKGEIETHARPEAGEEVKGIEEFKQQAGNPVPAYDQGDRMASRQGTVVFQAYVTKEGTPQEFELIESSGHRSLDYKTLKALKAWKFEAGQEGWVEIPFRWDLKGGPQELPSTLRKKLSSRPDTLISK